STWAGSSCCSNSQQLMPGHFTAWTHSTSLEWSWESNLRMQCWDARTPTRLAQSGSACHYRILDARYDIGAGGRALECVPRISTVHARTGMLEQETIVAEHWMPALQELARRTSHEVRNALNGVSVNLEVIRSRLDRAAEAGDEVAASVVPFARSAAEQLDQLAGITEAFLSLSRSAASGSADMLPLVTRATSLARYIARSEGRGVTFTASGDGEVFTST